MKHFLKCTKEDKEAQRRMVLKGMCRIYDIFFLKMSGDSYNILFLCSTVFRNALFWC